MESVKQTAADILNSAAWNLENNIIPWGKREFYQFLNSDPEDTSCQMCAHGAIGYFGNDKIKKLIGAKVFAYLVSVEGSSARIASANASYYIKQILSGKFGEVGKAHYLANKVGLDYSFNDHPRTTKEMVIVKLREAAKLYPKINEL